MSGSLCDTVFRISPKFVFGPASALQVATVLTKDTSVTSLGLFVAADFSSTRASSFGLGGAVYFAVALLFW